MARDFIVRVIVGPELAHMKLETSAIPVMDFKSALQERLGAFALESGLRISGPNCLGVMWRAGIRTAPRGDSVMKSSTTVNCRNASSATTNF